MNPATIEIHEFSTGIRPERTADGGWVSRGFTGQYMNMTLASVPLAVERSIANREFAVTEGASSDQPAIIGRVVGSGEEAWSVIAVVTRGRDEIGRSLSVYRYFLCQGDKENLRLILAWWDGQGMPRFNPFDAKTVGQPNLFDVTSAQSPNIPQEARSLPIDSSEPILIAPTHQYNLQTINTLAIKKFNTHSGGQSASWAFNVEALEQPRRFQVIQAASQRAYEILQRAIKNVPQALAPVFADEEALKSAIRGLINSSQVKPEAVQTIADALQNQQITQEYWHSLFDGQGAKTAISQKIYSPQMVRLITLRAMVIPETITEFLAWLNVKSIKDKADENQNISLEFQKSVSANFPKENLADGIKYILPKLLNRTITPESVYWLLIKSGSAWVYCQKQFLHDIVNDLEIIRDYFENTQRPSTFPHELLNCNQEIWKKLINYWKLVYFSNHYVECYKPFAELFEYIKEYSLSAYFYQVSEGRVPKNVFYEVAEKNNIHANYFTFLDLTIEREVTWLESFINFIFQEYIVPIQLVIPLSILIFLSGLFVGSKFLSQQHSSDQQNSANVSVENTTTSNPNSASSSKQISQASQNPTVTQAQQNKSQDTTITGTALIKALNKFDKTSNVIKQIVNEIQKEDQLEDTKIKNALKHVLKDTKLSYAEAFENKLTGQKLDEEKKKWVIAIYNYQKNKNPKNAVGFMDRPGARSGAQTYRDLKEDIKQYLNENYSGENPPEIR